MGYDVHAVHIQAVYPQFLYWFAKIAQKRIAAKTSAVVYTKRENEVVYYKMDEVPVCRIPVFKPIPHGAFARKSIKHAVDVIVKSNKEESFVPDIIIGHFPNPQLDLLYELRQVYTSSKTCEVLHLPEEIDQLKGVYGKNLTKYIQNIDVWGFRFKHLRELFSERFGQPEKTFICYSGVPSTYIREGFREVEPKVTKFLFVGEMIERKFPIKILDALNQAYPDNDFHINYIGDGALKSDLQRIVQKDHKEDNVSVLGRIPRELIKDEYDKADCFVMISKGEAYGLVYLEAMARGCITIASRNEGFDGVIVDGENGFLCNAGNAGELADVIKRIKCLSKEERQRVSNNAIETALKLTDEKAAKLYIEDVISKM